MQQIQAWQAAAFNQAEDSSNRIHSDEMALAYGFKGALVPGVTVSAYLMHPALQAWGEAWLTRGHAHVVVKKPLYDGYRFDVDVREMASENIALPIFEANLTDQEGTRCASGTLRLTENPVATNTLRGDKLLDKSTSPAPAERNEMERLRDQGMFALTSTWQADNHMSTYLKNPKDMPDLHRIERGHNTDQSAYANGAFLLSMTNWVLAGNAYMNPWIHLQTTSQYYAAVPLNTELVAECNIQDLFNRSGHEFVDLNVDVYVRASGEPVMNCMLRAIYKLRPPSSS